MGVIASLPLFATVIGGMMKLTKVVKGLVNRKERRSQMEKKKGIRTSEFWVAIIVAIVAVLNEKLGMNIPVEMVGYAVQVVSVYIISRLGLKVTETIKNTNGGS